MCRVREGRLSREVGTWTLRSQQVQTLLTISWRQTSRQRRGQWRRELPGAERQVRENTHDMQLHSVPVVMVLEERKQLWILRWVW